MTEGEPQRMKVAGGAEPLRPLPYHRAIVSFLKREEPDLWVWFSSAKVRQGQAEAVRMDLLKSTYRIERETMPAPYALADEVAATLGLSCPVTFYQSQESVGMNAALAYVPGEAHLVLQGPVLTTLTAPQLKALVGHELTHFHMDEEWGGDYLVAAEVLAAGSNDESAGDACAHSVRLFALYREVLCDRGALAACGELDAAVAMQVKIATGLKDVSADSYMRQADEVFAADEPTTGGLTHPESFIRARALRLWSERGEEADEDIRRMIEGRDSLDALDLLAQGRVRQLTRRVIDALLAPRWFHTEIALAHARMFHESYAPPKERPEVEDIAARLAGCDEGLRDYFCYVLLDFVAADRGLEDLPLAAALALGEAIGLADRFAPIAVKELGLRKSQYERLRRDCKAMVDEADRKADPS